MKSILEYKELLKDDTTLILVKDDNIIKSTLTGIKPLINLLNENKDLRGYSIADKIVGKAQAMLIVKAGIKEVYAKVLSIEGEKILQKYNIPYYYDVLTDKIINRAKTDICPMEKVVQNINDIEDAYIALKNKVATMWSSYFLILSFNALSVTLYESSS